MACADVAVFGVCPFVPMEDLRALACTCQRWRRHVARFCASALFEARLWEEVAAFAQAVLTARSSLVLCRVFAARPLLQKVCFYDQVRALRAMLREKSTQTLFSFYAGCRGSRERMVRAVPPDLWRRVRDKELIQRNVLLIFLWGARAFPDLASAPEALRAVRPFVKNRDTWKRWSEHAAMHRRTRLPCLSRKGPSCVLVGQRLIELR